MAEQEPVQDAQDPVPARHKITGVAITWDADQILFLPVTMGTELPMSGPFTSC